MRSRSRGGGERCSTQPATLHSTSTHATPTGRSRSTSIQTGQSFPPLPCPAFAHLFPPSPRPRRVSTSILAGYRQGAHQARQRGQLYAWYVSPPRFPFVEARVDLFLPPLTSRTQKSALPPSISRLSTSASSLPRLSTAPQRLHRRRRKREATLRSSRCVFFPHIFPFPPSGLR